MKRPATTSLIFKKGRFLSIFVFVAFVMAVSSLTSIPVSAFTINENKTISFVSSNYCDVDWNLDTVFEFKRNFDLGSQGNSYSGEPKAYDDWLKHIKPNIKDYKYLIYRNNTKVHVIINYQNLDKYQLYFPKTGYPRLTDLNKAWDLKDKVYKPSQSAKWQDYDLMIFTLLPSPKNKPCVSYPIHVSSGLTAFPISPFNLIPDSAEIYRSNFIIKYDDGYSGPVLPIPLEDTLIKKRVDYSYSVNKNKIDIQFYKPDDFSQSEWDNMKVQQVYNIGVQCDSGLIADFKDDVGIDFHSGLKYYFPEHCSVSSPQNLVFRFHFQSYDLKKYDFETLEFSIQYTSNLVKSYNSNVSRSPIKTCDLFDIPCHFNNFFIKFFEFIKWIFIPNPPSFNRVLTNFSSSVSEVLGSINGLFSSIMLFSSSIVQSLFPLIFDINYSAPCNFIPSFSFFSHSFNIDLCKFESVIGSGNFLVLRNLISVVLVFGVVGMYYWLVSKIGDILAS